MKRFAPIALMATAVALLLVPGCSKDDSSTNNNNNTSGARIYMQLKANTQFIFDRSVLDSLNQPVNGTTHQYQVDIKGNGGGLYLGSYRDWFYRVGTDKLTNQKDTVYVRTNTGSAGGASFTKDVEAYGFITDVLNEFIDQLVATYPITRPAVAGPQWDIIALYQDDAGNAYDVGKTWTIGNPNGEQLPISIGGVPLTITVTFTGRLDAKGEIITVSGKQIKTWKTTITMTANLPIGSPFVVKLSMWFSDDPGGPIQVVQQSGKLVIPLTSPLFIPGEQQILTSYTY